MGACYSHMVFFPPERPSYADVQGNVSFPRLRDGEVQLQQWCLCPIEYVETGRRSRVPLVLLPCRSVEVGSDEVTSGSYIDPWVCRYTILFSHGNAEDLGLILPYAEEIGSLLRCNMVCYDYSGYGVSKGHSGPSEKNFYADIEAVYDYLTATKGIEASRIILAGRSLGSGPTCHLAQRRDVRGVILISPIASCIRVVFDMGRVTLPFDMFCNLDKIHRIEAPVLIIHGDADEVVPFTHGQSLYDKLVQHQTTPHGPRPIIQPLWLAGGDHNTIESDLIPEFKKQVVLRYRQFLGELDSIPLRSVEALPKNRCLPRAS
mmetsp:Transcript_13258/g.26948  ORF Transcript_13258/g.26948 Transcript_13258/m.26948 type:complete len:318 (-) Transcript_13258:1277-2230(-)